MINWIQLILLLLVLLITWYFYKFYIRRWLSPLQKIPGCPYHPIVGNMLEVRKSEAMTSTIKWMKDLKSKIIRFYFFGGQERLLVADPDIFRHVLVTNSKNYVRYGIGLKLLDWMDIQPLFVLSGENHHVIRKISNPAFSLQALYEMVPVFNEKALSLINQWSEIITDNENGADIGVQMSLSGLTLDVICKCGCEYELQAIENNKTYDVERFRSMLSNIGASFLDLLPFSKHMPFKRNKRLSEDIAYVKKLATTIIQKKEHHLKESGKYPHKDILSILMSARDEEGLGLSDKDLFGQILGFLIAGYETTSTSMTWTLLQLAQNPDIQDKVRSEVQQVLGTSTTEITPGHLDKLHYLTCVIKETLRLLPPITSLFRKSLHDDKFKDYDIPAGTIIGLHIGALHRLNWEDPDRFNPERFMTSTEEDSKKFLPFGFGPYMCIGNKFAYMEMKTVLALLVKNFKFTMVPGYTFRRVTSIVMRPSPSLVLRVTKV